MAEEDLYLQNFPFPQIRDSQKQVIKETAEAFAEGKKIVIVEAPTGFGKSAYAVCVGNTFGKAYYITATKDLQEQYLRDFPFIKMVKGRNNFECKWSIEEEAKQDKLITIQRDGKEFRPMADEGECTVAGKKTKCPYYISKKNYQAIGQFRSKNDYCSYYVQRYDGELANQTIYNYKYFIPNALYNKGFEDRPLMVFDECHELESQIKDFLTLNLEFGKIDDIVGTAYRQGHDSLMSSSSEELLTTTKNWLPMIQTLYSDLTSFIEDEKSELEEIMGFKVSINFGGDAEEEDLDDAEEEDSEESIAVPTTDKIMGLDDFNSAMTSQIQDIKGGKNAKRELRRRIKRLYNSAKIQALIDKFLSDYDMNRAWIVGDVRRDNKGITKVVFMPIVVGSVARMLFQHTDRVILMSATILDHESFCKSIGLQPTEVKFIQVGSDFPIENRLIHCMNIERLNWEQLQKEEVVNALIRSVDQIMDKHANEKGIIHTTSKQQVKWLIEGTEGFNGISYKNRKRLLTTTLSEDDMIRREEVVVKHRESKEPTVLCSPSLQEGLDLKDDLARFAIIIKVPWPDLKDRWISARKKYDPQWYIWQTALKMIQAYGRAVRSKEDYATTYVLDSGFTDFCVRYKKILPQWFKRAIRVHEKQ